MARVITVFLIMQSIHETRQLSSPNEAKWNERKRKREWKNIKDTKYNGTGGPHWVKRAREIVTQVQHVIFGGDGAAKRRPWICDEGD